VLAMQTIHVTVCRDSFLCCVSPINAHRAPEDWVRSLAEVNGVNTPPCSDRKKETARALNDTVLIDMMATIAGR
jgi:hypothetical protein